MSDQYVKALPNLTKDVVSGKKGFMLDAYLVALEGFRRGLTLTWYKAESEICDLDRLNSSTNGKFFSLSDSEKEHYFFRSRGDLVANKTVRLVQNKEETKMALLKKGVPVPKGKNFHIKEADKEIQLISEQIGFPQVIKPRNGSMGKAVYTNLNNFNEVKVALEDLRGKYRFQEYIIEKYHPGKEYRIYVVGDKVVAATNRIPANVIGDGKRSIKDLIVLKNKERKKNPYLAPKPIKVDFEVQNTLKNLGYTLDSVPADGENLFLKKISNLSSGGDPIDATDDLSEEIKQIAVDTLKALPNIPHAGVDIIVDPILDTKGVVLEVNATAEIAFHMFPLEGKARNVPEAIIDYYFPSTTESAKSTFYFDYQSIIEPLSIGVVDKIELPKPPVGDSYGKIYIASGKLNKVGYMNWIKRQALHNNINGFVKKLENGDVKIFVSGAKNKVDKFKEKCRKGSRKSVVNNVIEKPWTNRHPVQVGFHLMT